jgi:hypothetical protein
MRSLKPVLSALPAFAALSLLAVPPAHALVHQVTDFRLDSSAAASDKFHLESGWGDSLLLLPQSFRYTSVKSVLLSNASGLNGKAGASPVVSTMGTYRFKVAYLAWNQLHDPAAPPASRDATMQANIVTRTIDLSPDTAAVDPQAYIIADLENTSIQPPAIAGFNYPGGVPPAPNYLHFSAEGDKYAAYWSSGRPNGPVRRTTSRDTVPFANKGKGFYVPSQTNPTHAYGWGELSSAFIPGTGGTKTVLAYETKFGPPGEFNIRWEDFSGASPVSESLAVATTVFPDDFAIAADSSGNTVVLWRQATAPGQHPPSDLYVAAFDNSHAMIKAPTLLQADIAYDDSLPVLDPRHLYRSYAVASMTPGNFLVAYAKVTPGSPDVCDIYTRTLALPVGAQAYSLGSAVQVNPNHHWGLFPDLAVSADRVVVGWFERPETGGPRRVVGTIFQKTGADYNVNARTDIDMANENVTFTGMGGNWFWSHWLRSASVAVDGKGNVVAAYDSGTHAKVALVRNTPIYHDSASFLSKSFKVENPAIPSFVFNPASDSVSFLPPRPNTTDSARTRIKVAVSPDNSFAGPASAFQPVPSSLKAAAGFYRYSVDLLTTITGNPSTTNLTTPKLKSLDIEYNVKPGTPAADSIKRGKAAMEAFNASAANTLLPRKDSLTVVCSGFDADDKGVEFRISLGGALLKSAAGVRTSAGNFAAALSLMPPDTVMNPLVLTLTMVDADGWSSRPYDMSFEFKNIPPSQTLTVYRNRGRDSSGVFTAAGGGVDTLAPTPGGLIVIQQGDSLALKAAYADVNDDTLTASWLGNSSPLGSLRLPVTDSLRIRYAPDTLAPAVDTLVMRAGDKDTTVSFRIPVRANHLPSIDSVFHLSYEGKDSVLRTGPFDVLRSFATDTGLVIPAGLPTTIKGGFSDRDLTAGDSLSVSWRVWKQAAGCPQGDLTCYQVTDSAQGTALTRAFDTREQYLTVRATDASGAFLERRVWLEYPVLDTAGAPGYAAAIATLARDIDFIIDAAKRDTSIEVRVLSKGSADLRILAAATKEDDRKWLELKLGWLGGSPAKPDSARSTGATNVDILSGGKTVSLPNSAALEIGFRFFSDSLRGDSVLTDTLLLTTNDFANPVLKIPFRLQHRDLPLVRLEVPGAVPSGPAGGFNLAGLPSLIPARSSLALGFTETVYVPDPSRTIRVYSYLDSLKNPTGYSSIPGTYEYRRKKAGAGKTGIGPDGFAAGFGKIAALTDSLADTVVFTPRYANASDSLKVKPQPGFFIYRDILHIAVSNAITDRAGNGLDLRLDRKFLAAGSFDTVFQARVDTSRFMVISTVPEAGSKGFDPEGAIKVRFNRKVSKRPPQGTDTLTLLDPNALDHRDNRSIKVTSVFRSGKVYDFQFISLADHDSSLVFRTRPLLPALDTVTVVLSGGILDTSGLSLDGDGDKSPNWLYDRRDSVDAYTFTFMTSEGEFYLFPNPFRYADVRHREKGSITFKNLNALAGYSAESDVDLRIHTMNGDLVYASDKVSDASRNAKKKDTSLEWDLRNTHGETVGTGVYIYTLMRDGKKLLHKGKVAVVR